MFSNNVNVNCDWGNHGLNNCSKYVDLEDINNEITINLKSGLQICHMNIVSLNKNIGKTEEFLSHLHFKLDAICLSETRFNINNSNDVKLSDYASYFNNSRTSAGGTAINDSDSFESMENSSLCMNFENCEDVWVDIALSCRNNSTLTVGSVYRHPQNNMDDFSEAFARNISTFVNKKHVILGDFNIRRRRRLAGHLFQDRWKDQGRGFILLPPWPPNCLGQMLTVRDFSQHLVSSSKTIRPNIPRGARCMRHCEMM